MVRWPDKTALQELAQLEGEGPATVIETIGHPKRLTVHDGATKWHYDWPAACYVTLKDDVVVEWFYNVGF